MSAQPRLRLRSATSGRERWEAPALLGQPLFCAALEQVLKDHAEITSVQVNPRTGRVLVHYSTGLTPKQMAVLVREALNSALTVEVTARTVENEPPSANLGAVVAGSALTLGAALASAPLIVGSTSIALPLALGTGVFAASWAIADYWRRRARRLRPFPRGHPAVRLYRYTKDYRSLVNRAATYSAVNKLLDLAPPMLIGLAVDIVANQGNFILTALGIASPMVQLISVGLLSVAIWILESLFEYRYERAWRRVAQMVQHDLRLDAYSHIQRVEMSYLDDQSTGQLSAVMSSDVQELEHFIDDGINDLIQNLVNFVLVGAIFFLVAPSVAWISVLPIPIILWGSFSYQASIGPLYERVRISSGRISRQLVNNLTGMPTIRSFTAEGEEVNRIRGLSMGYVETNQPAIQLKSTFTPMIRMAVLAGFAGTLVVGGVLALSGGMSAGAYTFIVFLTQRFLWPLTTLGMTVDLYERAMASGNRVLNLLEAPVGPDGGDEPLPLDQVKGNVKLDKVHFAYAGGPPVLKGISLEMPAGETTAIVGSTGSGKTTIIKLLLHFYDLDSGTISIDGRDISKLKLRDLRNSIGLVSQDVFLFDGTVAENIGYGRANVDREAIVEAARLAEADGFIRELPAQYETIIGERGMKLSGGQRQRLAIARALIRNPPILVMDEATSAVDYETEEAIRRSMSHIVVGRTTVIIAHRLSTVRGADRIYVLDSQGRIVETGKHDELIAASGVYARLWEVQTGGPIAPQANGDKKKKQPTAKKSAPRKRTSRKKK